METGCSRTTRVVGGQYVVNGIGMIGYKLVGTHTCNLLTVKEPKKYIDRQ